MNTPSTESARKVELMFQFERDIVSLMRTDIGKRLLAVICENHNIHTDDVMAYFESIYAYEKKRNKFRTKITQAIARVRRGNV